MKRIVISAVAIALSASYASAVVVDGTKDAAYGAPIVVQSNTTGFGDSTNGTQTANGSELDAGYGKVSGGRLYLFLAGNLESNFNKLSIFIDSGAAGGQNTVGTLTNNQGNFNNMTGMKFDSGFNATNWIAVTTGNPTNDIYVDYGNLLTGVGNYAGHSTPGAGTLDSSNGGPTLEATLNNTNVTGVTGSTAPNDAATVSTGVEVSIALSDLGYTSGNIRVLAFINGGNEDFGSNQFLGGLPFGTGNLGGDGAGNYTGNLAGVDLTKFAGNQYFTIAVPEPTTLAALAGAGVLALRRRK